MTRGGIAVGIKSRPGLGSVWSRVGDSLCKRTIIIIMPNKADDDDFSDLTSLDDDGSDFGASTSKKKKKKTGQSSGGYKIKNALRVPRATTYTAQSLYGTSLFLFSWRKWA